MTDQRRKKLDDDLDDAIRHWHRLRWIITSVSFAILVVALLAGGITLSFQQDRLNADELHLRQDNERLLSSCDFYRPLTGLPATSPPSGGPPSKFGISIIVGSRRAYLGQKCPGQIPPTNSSLAHWAQHYGIKLP